MNFLRFPTRLSSHPSRSGLSRRRGCKETPAQKKISLNVVKRLAKEEVSYDRLREAVDEAIVLSDSYYMDK